MNEFYPIPGCRVDAITSRDPDHLHVDACGTRPGGRCPECGRASRAVHSRYRRHPSDLPSLGRRVRVVLRAATSRSTAGWRRRTAPAKVGRRRVEDLHDAGAIMGRGKEPYLPAARRLAWLLVQPVAALDATAAAVVSRVEQDGQAKIAATLARQFTALVRACGLRDRASGTAATKPVAELDAWLAEARAYGIGAVETFAVGLEVDGAAVRAALTEPWSSGQAGRQVNRLKLLKRQSYGRASFDLLRRRVLLAV